MTLLINISSRTLTGVSGSVTMCYLITVTCELKREKLYSTPHINIIVRDKLVLITTCTYYLLYICSYVTIQPKIIFLLLFISSKVSRFSESRARTWNKTMKSSNGNHQFRVVHLNKGKSILHNYLAPLEDLLTTTTASICSLNEANLDTTSNLCKNGILDYACEYAATPPGSNLSRVCVFIKSSVNYKRRLDLEPGGLACVCIEVKLGRLNFIFIGYY